jgi:hypothetical protein
MSISAGIELLGGAVIVEESAAPNAQLTPI